MITNDILTYIDNNKAITEEMIKEYVLYLSKINDLQEYLKDTIIFKNVNKNCTAKYSFTKRIIMIDTNSIMNLVLKKYHYQNTNSIYSANIMCSLYHEFIHANQNKIVHEGENSIEKIILSKNYEIFEICTPEIYQKNYYNYSMEINAFVKAYTYMMWQLGYNRDLTKTDETKRAIFIILSFNFIKTLKSFYDKTSPVERSNINLSQFDYKSLDNFEKISLGLPIEEETRKKVLNISYVNCARIKKYVNNK